MDEQPVGLESIDDFEASLIEPESGRAPGGSAAPAGSSERATGSASDRPSARPVEAYERWVGKQFAHFRLMRSLGAGSMGVVFQAQDIHLQRICAIKVLRRQLRGDDRSPEVERFLLEARAAATLDHPCIASVYEINQHAGWWFIAQEYLEGGSLQQLVQATGPLAPDRLLLLAVDAARGLEAAHESGIIHRDIKPANLMLTRRGRCKVVDFGLVKLDSSENPFQEDDKKIVGSPLYVAPEVVARTGALPASDVYSFGATLYALLTKRPPYVADSVEKVLKMHLEAPVPNVRERLPACPAILAGLVVRAMAKNPAERPTMAKIAATLQGEITAHAGLEASPRLTDSGRLAPPIDLHSGESATAAGSARSGRSKRARALRIGGLIALGGAAIAGAWMWSAARARRGSTPATTAAAPATLANEIGMTFAAMAPGAFTMGSPASEAGRNSDERQFEATITRPFAISVTEVTQEQWARVMGDDYAPPEGVHPNETSGRRFLGPSLPAYVSWFEAAEFCRRLSLREDRLYRLPTEAEWEYACRAGGGEAFAFGARLDAAQANVDFESGGDGAPPPMRPLPVASYHPNAFGLHDMHGNVMEWCADWMGEHPIGPASDPTGPADGSARVVRGGSWDTGARVARSANRWAMPPVVRTDSIGFRVVLERDAPPTRGLAPYLIERQAPAAQAAHADAGGADRPSIEVDPALPSYEPTAVIDQRIRSVGSDTMDRLMRLWERRFQEWHPSVEVRHEGRGSGTAAPALLEGISHFGPMSRALKDEERSAYAAEHGYEPIQLTVAIDTLAVFVHPSNPLLQRGATLAELDAIFSSSRRRGLAGDIVTWGDLGLEGEWADAPVRVYGRNAASGTYGVFREMVLLDGDYRPTNTELIGSAEVVEAVAQDPFAIGYSGIGYATPGVRAVAITPEDGEAPVAPAPMTAYDGTYPLARQLFLTIDLPPGSAPTARQREFLRFVYSREGQELVVDAGFFPLDAGLARENLSRLGVTLPPSAGSSH